MVYLAGLLLFLFLLRRCLAIITVHGRSMEPTLVNGDRVLLLRFGFRYWLRTGQIVVCQYPAQDNYIKRLLSLGGDCVVLPAQAVSYGPLPNGTVSERDAAGNFVWQVPSGHCFVKGDAASSYDSTSWGPIPLDDLTGIVLLKLPHRPATG